MVKLRIQELAHQQGISLGALQRQAQVPIVTMRRYWHASRTGNKCDAGTLKAVNLLALGKIAQVLNVRAGDLIDGPNEDTNNT
jgi:hypothetical protein